MLTQPRLLTYRPPPSSSKRSSLKPDESEEHFVEVKFTVTKDGRTENVEVVEQRCVRKRAARDGDRR